MTRLSDESVRMLRDLFAKHAENGATIFHQAHAEELLALAEEVIAMRSETAALAPASAYVLAIQQSVGSILSQYSANKILDRAKEIANGH